MDIERRKKRHVTSFQIIIIGFLAVILLGSLILMLPAAARTGKSTNFLDDLFTATSAVCVTGLVVRDTATYWSFFGQAVILLLIQIGGMGVVTIAVAVAAAAGRKIGLMQRSTMQEAISAPQVGGIVRMIFSDSVCRTADSESDDYGIDYCGRHWVSYLGRYTEEQMACEEVPDAEQGGPCGNRLPDCDSGHILFLL